jgi:biotin operon repressor
MSLHLRGTLACLLCARVAATVSGPRRDRLAVRVLDPACTPFVRRQRCPICNGRLWLSELETVTVVDRRKLAPEQPGRPPKTGATRRQRRWVSGPASDAYACIDCGEPRPKTGRKRCRPCAIEVIVEARRVPLLALLARVKRPLSSREIAARLGYSADSVRKLIARAKADGARIETVGYSGGYRLVSESQEVAV